MGGQPGRSAISTTTSKPDERESTRPDGADTRPRRRLSTPWRLALQAALLAGAGVFVVRRMGDLSGVASLMTHVRWRWMVVAIAAQFLAILALAAAQHLLLRTAGSPSRLGRMTALTLASNAVARSVPAGVVVAEGYTFRQYRRLGADAGVAAWTELATGALSVSTLAALAMAGLAVTNGVAGKTLLGFVAVCLVGSFVAAALFARPARLAVVMGRVVGAVRRLLPERAARHLHLAETSIADMRHIRPDLWTWGKATVLTGLNWVLDAVCLATAVRAVGAQVKWWELVLAFVAAQLLSAIPITIGGLGVVEGGLVVMLTTFGTAATVAGAGALAYRSISFGLLAVAGWACFAGLRIVDRGRPTG